MEPPLNHPRTPKSGGSLEAVYELPFSSPAFAQAWNDWQSHLRERRQKRTPTAMRLQLSQLGLMGESRAIAALRHSTASGYTGLYEPRQTAAKGNPERRPTGYASII